MRRVVWLLVVCVELWAIGAAEGRRSSPFGRRVADPSISVAAVHAEIDALSARHGARLKVTTLGEIGGHEVPRLDISPAGASPRMRVLVTAGVHGNEPAGVHAALELARVALRGRDLGDVHLTILPMVNPVGLSRRIRGNGSGQDVNRSFRAGKWTQEARLVEGAVKGERFDLALDLHGTVRRGFMMIRTGDDGGLSRRALTALDRRLLLGGARVGPYALSGRGEATTANPGTLKAFMHDRGALAYTLEYPRKLTMSLQAPGLLRLIRSTVATAGPSSSRSGRDGSRRW